MKYIIRDSWKLLHLFCGEHGMPCELKMERSSRGIVYSCPYRGEYTSCNTRITMEEYEAILTQLSDMIVQADMNGEILDITNTTWKLKKRITCKVLAYGPDKIDVLVNCRH